MVTMTTNEARSLKSVDEFKTEFKKLADASIGLILIRTREARRCCGTLMDISVERDVAFKIWACNKGWLTYANNTPGVDVQLNVNRPAAKDENFIDIHKAIEHVNNETRPGVYVMQFAHHAFEKPLIQQDLKDFVVKSREEDLQLVILAPETVKIPGDLEDDLHVMDFRAPSHAELTECYDGIMRSIDDADVRPDFDEDEITVIVQNAVGMTWLEFEAALTLAVIEVYGEIQSGKIKKASVDDYIRIILRHKTEAIKKTDMLELMPAASMDDVGGYDLLKEWLRVRQKAYSEEARQYGVEVPRGMLCVGPPGSGKSLVAKACSSVLQVPLIKFDIGKVFGRYVGESEGRVRSALTAIESMAPCVLLVDEIDKGFGGIGGGGGDSGVSMRVLGSFLNWMQDRDIEKHPVFIVATANNVTGLPPELMRRGRMDEIFACSFPSADERIEILRIHLRKRGHKLSDSELTKVAEQTDKFVGSELEGIVQSAILEAFDKSMKAPTGELLVKHAKSIRPLYLAFADRVNAMHEWAKNNARPASSGMRFEGVAIDQKKAARPGIRAIRTPIKGSRNLDG